MWEAAHVGEGLNVKRVTGLSAIVLLSVPALLFAQPTASVESAPAPSRPFVRIRLPETDPAPVVRAAAPDRDRGNIRPVASLSPPDESRPAPAGSTSPRAVDLSPDDRYNWGVVAEPVPLSEANRNRDKPKSRDTAKERSTDTRSKPANIRRTSLERDEDGEEELGTDRYSDPGRKTPSKRNKGFLDSDDREKDTTHRSFNFGDFFRNLGEGGNRGVCESDHDFDSFIGPTTNPFLAEDPRALSELRLLYLYQSIPSSQYLFRGGNAMSLVLQGRLALTQRLSIVVNKLGLIILNPGSESLLSGETGVTELWLGPKFTFYRNPDANRVIAAGGIFQIPIGSDKVFQNTGRFGLTPYVSYAEKFLKTSLGEFGVLNTLGYSFSFDNRRSDYFYNSLHVDLDVFNGHRFWPFLELNYFHYTTNGREREFLGFEGEDLINFGGGVKGRNFVSIAPGVRVQLTEKFQVGLAAEFPILGTRDINDFRLGVDLIFRY